MGGDTAQAEIIYVPEGDHLFTFLTFSITTKRTHHGEENSLVIGFGEEKYGLEPKEQLAKRPGHQHSAGRTSNEVGITGSSDILSTYVLGWRPHAKRKT